MLKKDELLERQSGLTVMDTLNALRDQALNTFEEFFIRLQAKGGGKIRLRTASRIATEMTTGVFSPLYGQIDPLHIGEAARAMSIAGKYGTRLLHIGDNVRSNALDIILSEYPSHGFVIDRQEAKTLFKNVREPDENEQKLMNTLSDLAWLPNNEKILIFLSSELSQKDKKSTKTNIKEKNDGKNTTQNKRTESNNATKEARVESSDGKKNNLDVRKLQLTQIQNFHPKHG